MVGTNQLLLRGEKSYHSMGVGPSDDNSHNEDNEAQNVWGYLERTLAGVSIETKGVKFRAGLLSHLKIWWPGTELNRRRQPFQNRGFEYFQRLTSRRGLP